jgi:hypothetical protein
VNIKRKLRMLWMVPLNFILSWFADGIVDDTFAKFFKRQMDGLRRIKYAFLFIIFFSLGSFFSYYFSKGVYEDYRLKNHSISIVGEVLSSNYFEERRGRYASPMSNPRRTIRGYKVDVKFNDSGVEKIKTFEVENDMKKGSQVKVFHVPETNITSTERKSDDGSIWGIILGIGFLFYGGSYGLKLLSRIREKGETDE